MRTTTVIFALLPLFLGACSSTELNRDSALSDPDALLVDEYFADENSIGYSFEQPDLFSLPDSYKKDLDAIMARSETEWERYTSMRSWINRRFSNFDFDVTETYTLSELSNNRKINCLSFSALFVAVARYLDISADFQLVIAQPYWDKEGENWINNQHINVTGMVERPVSVPVPNWERPVSSLGAWEFPVVRRTGIVHRALNETTVNQHYTADVNPAVVSMQARTRILSEREVLSLFYSNKSVESLLNDDLSLSYYYTKLALQTDAGSVVAWNNLGVLYNRVKQSRLSIAAYERAIALDDEMFTAKSNLANSYRAVGEVGRAVVLEREVENFREQNPYYHSSLAEARMSEGDYRKAIDHLRTALDQKHNEHFFYHLMAQANLQLGDMDAVVENLGRARRYARGSEKIRFSNKLRQLESVAVISN